jgi:hypothetical protein
MNNIVNNTSIRGLIYRAIGTAASANIKNRGGRILSYSCTNLNATIRYFQLFDTTAAPSPGATPTIAFPVYGSSGLLIIDGKYLGDEGTLFTTGISFGFSTTPLTYTAGTASDAIVEVRYL